LLALDETRVYGLISPSKSKQSDMEPTNNNHTNKHKKMNKNEKVSHHKSQAVNE
jgi:hypothetical protein